MLIAERLDEEMTQEIFVPVDMENYRVDETGEFVKVEWVKKIDPTKLHFLRGIAKLTTSEVVWTKMFSQQYGLTYRLVLEGEEGFELDISSVQ